jgi:hypothetical protein
VNFSVEPLEGGYRPTTSGTVLGRPICFRVTLSRWTFLVGHETVTALWWHSPDSDIVFSAGGRCRSLKAPWHTEAGPLLLRGLEDYLDFSHCEAGTRAEILATARAQLSLRARKPWWRFW